VLEYPVANLVAVDMIMPNDKPRIVFCHSCGSGTTGSRRLGVRCSDRNALVEDGSINWPGWPPVFVVNFILSLRRFERQTGVLSRFHLPVHRAKIHLRRPTFSTSGSRYTGSTTNSTLSPFPRNRFLYSAGDSMSVPPCHMPLRAALTQGQ
jgi:hypothetical protein